MKEGQFSVPRLAMPCITIHSSGGQFIDLQILMSSKPSMIHYDSHMCRSFVPFRSESQDVPESMRRREKRAFWQNLRKLLRFFGEDEDRAFSEAWCIPKGLGFFLDAFSPGWAYGVWLGKMAWCERWEGVNTGQAKTE